MNETTELQVNHPSNGEVHTIHVPADHDGSRIRVEFPDGATTFTEGWDPADRAVVGERPTVPCGNCGQPQVLTASEFTCSACGAKNRIELQVASEVAEGHVDEAG